MTKHWNQQCPGIILLVALFLWENKKEEEQLAQITRNETLSRLPLRLSTNRIVELVQLRDTVRPVSIVALRFFLQSLCIPASLIISNLIPGDFHFTFKLMLFPVFYPKIISIF